MSNKHINTIIKISEKTNTPLEKVYNLYEIISKKYSREYYQKNPTSNPPVLKDNPLLTQYHERALETIKRFYQIKFYKENKYNIEF